MIPADIQAAEVRYTEAVVVEAHRIEAVVEVAATQVEAVVVPV